MAHRWLQSEQEKYLDHSSAGMSLRAMNPLHQLMQHMIQVTAVATVFGKGQVPNPLEQIITTNFTGSTLGEIVSKAAYGHLILLPEAAGIKGYAIINKRCKNVFDIGTE